MPGDPLRTIEVNSPPGIPEVELFDKEIFFLENFECITDSPGRQVGSHDNIFMGHSPGRAEKFLNSP